MRPGSWADQHDARLTVVIRKHFTVRMHSMLAKKVTAFDE